jgi:toxin-antitoxin system PIN domain toxin
MFLLDINVWLALTFDSHIHHPPSKQWFDALSTQVCYFCRVTQLGFLRIASDRKVFGPHALTLRQAWNAYDVFRGDLRIAFAEEPADLESDWRSRTQTDLSSSHVWNDAFLAAFAKMKGWEIVTFDKGFKQFNDLSCTILS